VLLLCVLLVRLLARVCVCGVAFVIVKFCVVSG
jgi:hypothetical protein